MNRYEHVINFQNDSAYRPKEYHDQLTAQKGDIWRWLIPKSATNDIAPEGVKIALVGSGFTHGCDVENGTQVIGKIRRQESEHYVDFSLWVGSLPTATDYRQFALQRENGQTLIGTFRGQQTTKFDYMEALKSFYEGFPATKVLCDVDGSKMRVRIWEQEGAFKLQDENLFVRLGESLVSNTNNPKIERINQGQIDYTAQDSYKVLIGSDIQEGNIFELGTRRYEAKSGATPEIVLAALNVKERILVDSGQAVVFGATAGKRMIQNTNRITARAAFSNTSGGNDRYTISIEGVIQVGNIIQVSATGKTTTSFTVLESTTVAQIEAFFNSTGGYYSVSAGVVPVVSYIAGFQEIANKNTPTMQLTDLTAIGAYSVTKWVLLVGSDVKAGNVFIVGEKKYTATSDDTALSVAQQFGYDSVSMTVETAVGVKPDAYALKGFVHDESNIADVTISEVPRLAISSQYVAEISFPETMDEGFYRLAILDDLDQVVSLGNFIRVKTEAEGEIIEVADQGDVFGYEYFENGLTQRLRLPISLNPPKQVFTEEKVSLFMGGYRRTTTKIEHVSTLVTRAGRIPFHITLGNFLKHNGLWIGGKAYYCGGEYSEVVIDAGSGLKQGKAELHEIEREKNNFSKYRSTIFQSGVNGGFARVSFGGMFDLWLTGGKIVRKIAQGETVLGAGSYEISGETNDSVLLKFYENGTLRLKIKLPKKERFKISPAIKLQSGSLWIIESETIQETQIPEITFVSETLASPEVSYTCQKITLPHFGQYNDDFGQDFKI